MRGRVWQSLLSSVCADIQSTWKQATASKQNGERKRTRDTELSRECPGGCSCELPVRNGRQCARIARKAPGGGGIQMVQGSLQSEGFDIETAPACLTAAV